MISIPYSFARQHGVVLEHADGGFVCGLRAGVSITAMAEITRIVGPSVRFEPLAPDAFETRLATAYRDNASDASDAAGADGDLASLADNTAIVDDLLDQSDDAPVVRLINALLLEAIKENASDIHIETLERRLTVRFRIDGVLRAMVEPKRALAPLLISRIKVMARLDIAEKRLPQDGRVSLRVGGHEVDVRVSTIPSQYGERVVMRWA
jgi:general secretion pathway protein E